MFRRRQQRSWRLELVRPLDGRVLVGVCAGLSRGLALDVTLLRLAFLLLGLASGLGVILYLLGWLLLPREGSGGWDGGVTSVVRGNVDGLSHDLRHIPELASAAWSRNGRERGWPRPLTRRWIAITVICAGLFVFFYSLGVFAWLGPGRTLGLAIVAVGAAMLVHGVSSRSGED